MSSDPVLVVVPPVASSTELPLRSRRESKKAHGSGLCSSEERKEWMTFVLYYGVFYVIFHMHSAQTCSKLHHLKQNIICKLAKQKITCVQRHWDIKYILKLK